MNLPDTKLKILCGSAFEVETGFNDWVSKTPEDTHIMVQQIKQNATANELILSVFYTELTEEMLAQEIMN